eukprot:CAMPEP_0117656456 /NCGR_PEP_ID=MMETSP0804-20121206/4814_1 /TAXON_ID=1074897 /ORGANISM="Tetraselmis astigmatica, Strain CCMP880" /LENGTH=239 /DNA_ID=CAMNT_0005462859 /DNA_START=475 /DNA_END=1191 /DNA_ORIENTATION=-
MEYQTFNTPDEVYQDFRGRREAILKALTTDVEKFYWQCDPDKENLCLYGYADKVWEVNLPAEEVPPEIPEPALGINFARDGMRKEDWLSLVAMHSDTWLLAVAFFNGSRLDPHQRAELFNMINSNPTIFEIIQGKAKGPKPKAKVQPPATVGKPKKQMDSRPPGGQPKPKPPKRPAADPAPTDEGSEDEYDDGEGDPCPSCGGFYKKDEFWIACDGCETWYHGKCVKVNPQNAEKIKTW